MWLDYYFFLTALVSELDIAPLKLQRYEDN